MSTEPIDVDALAVAIAARYAPGQLTAPGGLQTIRWSSASPPQGITITPVVVVSVAEGEFETGHGTRQGGQDWFVRFYLDKLSDLARQGPALRKWLSVLIYQHKTAAQLGGTVDVIRLMGWRIGVLPYAGIDFAGIELSVHTVTTESWAAVA
jgi:hypothetical protein